MPRVTLQEIALAMRLIKANPILIIALTSSSHAHLPPIKMLSKLSSHPQLLTAALCNRHVQSHVLLYTQSDACARVQYTGSTETAEKPYQRAPARDDRYSHVHGKCHQCSSLPDHLVSRYSAPPCLHCAGVIAHVLRCFCIAAGCLRMVDLKSYGTTSECSQV